MELDTIVAIVTPPGEGGVGIVRTSGPLSTELPERLFPHLKAPWESHRLRHGEVVDPTRGEPVDQALGCVMRAPHSYTGEDVFEIHCHGSPLVLQRLLQICFAQGCRAARPGEFTLRAFLNHRIDLSQAEAVLDVVRARSNLGLEMAVKQLQGWLSERIEPLRQELTGILAQMEAMVDFVEQDVPPELPESTRRRLEKALQTVEKLLVGAEQGIVLREGASLAIVGSPNVGKSSIMNQLLGLDRSIVTPIPGTTRDTVEETLLIGDVPFRTVDTAGITETKDLVERIGVERSHQVLEAADVVLLVLDRSRPYSEHDELTVASIESALADSDGNGSRSRLVVALNKADLDEKLDASPAIERLKPAEVVESSAIEAGGIDALRDALRTAAAGGNRDEFLVGNVRHQQALKEATDGLRAVLAGLDGGIPLDLVSFDLRASVQALGEITGANVDDELLDRIFRDFCIGK